MSNIYVSSQGNGTAYVDNPTPLDGVRVTLYAYPASGERIEDIYATDSYGHYIALGLYQEQSFVYDETWGDVFIEVRFSGTTPPPTPTTLDAWLIVILKKVIERRRRK